jgi:glycosyltransferase involved in cell wall biosynthesis
MRILQVIPRLSSKYGGGGFTIAKMLTLELAKRGHKVGVFTSDYDVDKDIVRMFLGNPNIWTFPFKTLFSLATLHVTSHPKNLMVNIFDKAVEDGGVDVIHIQGLRTWQAVIASQWAKKYNIPYVVDAHGFPIEGAFLRKLFIRLFDALLANKIARDAKFCIAETETGVREYLREGVKRENIVIIPCPYDLNVFDSLPKRGQFRKGRKLQQQQRIVLFLGGLSYIKGLDFLVKAFARLNSNDAVLVLVGEDMGFKPTLDKLVAELGIQDKVIFTGGLYGQEKLEALVDADVAVFPSRAEQGLPFAALEAIMCGTPIIVSDGTGAADDVRKIHDVASGYLVKFGDEQGLLVLFRRLIGNKYAKVTVSVMQDYIRKNLSITEKVKDYEELYQRCLI